MIAAVEPTAPSVPASAYVVIVSVLVAVNETFAGLVVTPVANKAPKSIEAVVVSLTMLIATPAPTPTLVESVSFTIAFAVLDTLDVAESERSPPLSSSGGGPRLAFDRTNAPVLMSAIVRANAPATATLPPPAPAVASVSSVCLPSPELRMAAFNPRPFDLRRTSMPTVAEFVILTRLIATAAPMFAVFALVALPFALTVESASSDELRFSALPTPPPVVTMRPPARAVMAMTVTMAMAAAAATVTVVPPFSPLFASGVVVEPEFLPLDALDVSLPTFRLSSAFLLTVLPLLSVSSAPEPDFSAAPAELAVASVSFDEEPSARKLTSPAAVRLRSSWESTL